MACSQFKETIVSPEETKVSLHKGIGIELGHITKHNIGLLRQIIKSVFPLDYSDLYYKYAATADDLARYVYYNDIAVGAIVCRVVMSLEDQSTKLYIMSLGCLKPYRRSGVGSKLLQYALDYGRDSGKFKSIFLHIQVNNDEALAFYKKFGFEIVKTIESYYSEIKPAGAHVLEKLF